MSYQPNKPLLSDEEIREIRSHHDHALSVKQSAYQVRDIYESHRAMDGRLIQVLVDALANERGETTKTRFNALRLAAENGYKPSGE